MIFTQFLLTTYLSTVNKRTDNMPHLRGDKKLFMMNHVNFSVFF